MTENRRFPTPECEPRRSRPTRARWIVSEPSGRWAIALRRESGAEGPRLYETRTLGDARSMMESFPASFLVAELTSAGVGPLLDWMVQFRWSFPMARIAVVADRAWLDWEWLVREAGATWFATSPREVRPIVAIARRHLRLVPGGSDFLEELWDLLPWKPFGEP